MLVIAKTCVGGLRILALIFIVEGLLSCSKDKTSPSKLGTQYVILKRDDLWFEQTMVHQVWLQVIDFLNEKNIVTTIGLVGDSLEKGDQDYLGWIRARDAEGHEIWNHGFCHCRSESNNPHEPRKSEFFGSTLDEQIESLKKTQDLARDKLGIELVSFGAPFNWVDENTAKALTKFVEIKVWLYGNTSAMNDKLVLERRPDLNIEIPVHEPNLSKFLSAYQKHKGDDVIVIQGHPRSWTGDPARWQGFVDIIEFLESQHVTFVTAKQYYTLSGEI